MSSWRAVVARPPPLPPQPPQPQPPMMIFVTTTGEEEEEGEIPCMPGTILSLLFEHCSISQEGGGEGRGEEKKSKQARCQEGDRVASSLPPTFNIQRRIQPRY